MQVKAGYQKLTSIRATLAYIIFIVLLNLFYPNMPFLTIAGAPFSSGDMVVGLIYILRDFAQREIKHYVMFAMLLGAAISYTFADQAMAVASLCSFVVAESLDWSIYTFTRKPLSQRLLRSSVISVPIDTLVFLAMYGPFNMAGMIIISASKILGVLFVWYLWRRQHMLNLSLLSKGMP